MNRGRLFWIVLAVIGAALILLIVNDSGGSTLGLPNDFFASLVYLGVWGTVLAVGILGLRPPPWRHGAQPAMWMLIILVFVAGYQYRYELQDFANRVTAGLVPGSPLTVNDGGNTVMLEKLANGHFGARGAVNGASVDFIIDTGASSTVLTAPMPKPPASTPPSSASTCRSRPPTATPRRRRSSPTRQRRHHLAHNVPVFVAERGQLEQSLLGMNFIGTLSSFEIRGDRMILRD